GDVAGIRRAGQAMLRRDGDEGERRRVLDRLDRAIFGGETIADLRALAQRLIRPDAAHRG
ncbi:hypothetical protein, partial [Litorisediminicola beolgyonensis]